MCGIVGIVSFVESQSSKIISPQILRRMSDLVIHRGPDSNGQWISKSNVCGFGFRRLAIIDLSSAGNQPMITTDEKLCIVFNGEVYNYLDLRKELEERGYKFKSRTDTEVILYGYREWGERIVERLSGMFAFVIWDEESRLLFGARDRLGKKPLYYTLANNFFIFASEIKSILAHPQITKRVNFDEIPNYLNFGTSSNRKTLFENIFKIPPAHCFKLTSDGKFVVQRYWNPFAQLGKLDNITTEEASHEIIRLLRQAIKDRMISDVPFGVFLSGGIDSGLNVALMAELMDRPVDTFTVGFKELVKYNELEYANKIVDLFKTNHHEILIDHNDAFPILEEIVWFEDEPNADPVCIPLFFLSKLTRESGTIVVQVGEGSDEQFVGYPWLLRDYKFYHKIWKPFSHLPRFLKKSIYRIGKQTFKPIGQYLPLDFIRRAAYDEEYYWSGISIFPPSEMDVMSLGNGILNISQPWEYVKSLRNEAESLSEHSDFLQWVLFTEISQRLSELLLMRVDKIGMANSIEARVPFLDYRIVEFTMALPTKIKVPDEHTTKYVLKKAVEKVLPKEIIYRRKQGFWAPVNEWLRNPWFEYAKSKINNSNLFKALFDMDYVNKILLKHRKGATNRGFHIFTLLELALWYEVFFDNQKID